MVSRVVMGATLPLDDLARGLFALNRDQTGEEHGALNLQAVLNLSRHGGVGRGARLIGGVNGEGKHGLSLSGRLPTLPRRLRQNGGMDDSVSHRPRIGLTGGIASGKSTVALLLAAKGATIIDADAIVRELQQPGGPALAAIVAEFGEGMLTADSTLDRAALGALVFGDVQARERLNAVVHPLVREEASRRIAAAPGDSTLVEDIPLLVETGQAGRFDRVLVVQAPREERIRRMVADRGMTPDDAAARIDAQATDAERAAVASDVLTNDSDVEHLSAQVDAFWESLGARG